MQSKTLAEEEETCLFTKPILWVSEIRQREDRRQGLGTKDMKTALTVDLLTRADVDRRRLGAGLE